MMSIASAIAAPSPSPSPSDAGSSIARTAPSDPRVGTRVGTPVAPPPATQPAGQGAGLTAFFVFWAVVGLGMATLLGAFRRRAIVGPERIGHDESAWGLLVAAGGGLFVGIYAAGATTAALRGRVSPEVLTLVGAVVVDGAGFVAMLAAAAALRGADVRRVGLAPRLIPFGVGGGLLAVVVLFPAVTITSGMVAWAFAKLRHPQAPPNEVLQLIGRDRSSTLVALAVLAAVVAAPLAEELLFRGLVQTMLGRLFQWAGELWRATPAAAVSVRRTDVAAAPGPVLDDEPVAADRSAPPIGPAARWGAVLVTAALFAAVHREFEFMPPLFVLAVGLGYVYERSGNLWMTVAAHGLFNATQMALFLGQR